VGIGVSAGLVVTLSVASLRGIYAVIEKSLKAIGELPEWANLLLAAGIVTAVAHPKSRNWLIEKWRRLKESLIWITPELAAVVENAARYYLDAQQKAMKARATLDVELPPARPRTAIQFARVICAASTEPISVDQIFIRMTAEGYVSGAKSPHRYIRQQMRLSGQFIEPQPGLWRLRAKEELQTPA